MKIDHIHFFVEDARHDRDWFIQHMGWQQVGSAILSDRHVEILSYRHTYFVFSSPRDRHSPIGEYLRTHAPGVVDIAFAVTDLDRVMRHLGQIPPWVQDASSFVHAGQVHDDRLLSYAAIAPMMQQFSMNQEQPKPNLPTWTCIQGAGGVRHTILEKRWEQLSAYPVGVIDHLVLNVPKDELLAAVEFYRCLLDLQPQQSFAIQTRRSGLHSQVLYSAEGHFYFNINEPTSPNSQIQQFLDINQGAGIQHIALQSAPIVKTVAGLRDRGLPLLTVPLTYYHQLSDRLENCQGVSGQIPVEWQQIMEQKILVDWQPARPESLLLQIFSRPIFPKSLFFFEFIERRQAAQGFGEGNFLALYQAIESDLEQSQLKT
ncbi:MAG: VOC family protein [Pseudanabaenaceae cyanobacterium bins.39]|nr:VOC family protein [Pseudanabaenaceae cyanobacterium bins.39]